MAWLNLHDAQAFLALFSLTGQTQDLYKGILNQQSDQVNRLFFKKNSPSKTKHSAQYLLTLTLHLCVCLSPQAHQLIKPPSHQPVKAPSQQPVFFLTLTSPPPHFALSPSHSSLCIILLDSLTSPPILSPRHHSFHQPKPSSISEDAEMKKKSPKMQDEDKEDEDKDSLYGEDSVKVSYFLFLFRAIASQI